MRISDWSSDVCSSDLSDSSQSFPLLKSFSACSDKVDMEALIATAQYKLYYIDAGGATVEVSDCTPDTDKVFAIVEKFDACTVALDSEKQTATPQSALEIGRAACRERVCQYV